MTRDARAHPRKIAISRVQLRWEDDSGTACVSTALLEDTSLQGACFRVHRPIVAGTRLQVMSHKGDFGGLVKYCRSTGSQYLIGVRRDPQPGAAGTPAEA
jgi:hypothetical protein